MFVSIFVLQRSLHSIFFCARLDSLCNFAKAQSARTRQHSLFCIAFFQVSLSPFLLIHFSNFFSFSTIVVQTVKKGCELKEATWVAISSPFITLSFSTFRSHSPPSSLPALSKSLLLSDPSYRPSIPRPLVLKNEGRAEDGRTSGW